MLPDLDFVLRDNNIFMMRTMILSGLVHEASEHRRFILADIDSGVFWEKSFQRYLFDLMRQQIHKNGEVSTEWLLNEIPKYTKVVYGSPEDRRDHL
jgi:hypothetical protein